MHPYALCTLTFSSLALKQRGVVRATGLKMKEGLERKQKVSHLPDALQVPRIHFDGILSVFSFSTAEHQAPSSLREACHHIRKRRAAPALPCRESGVCGRAGTKMLQWVSFKTSPNVK
eukprot:s11_g27.t1